MAWIRERRFGPEDGTQWFAALKRARIPERYWSAQLAAVKDDARWLHEAINHPEAWADKGWGFYINGPFNTGKTAAAALLAMEFVKRCHHVLWLAVREIPGVRWRQNDALAALDTRLGTADMVVVDDLGAENFKVDSLAWTTLEETVRIVTERGRSVTFTSNTAWESFPAVYRALPAFVSVVRRYTIPVSLTSTWPDEPGLRSV